MRFLGTNWIVALAACNLHNQSPMSFPFTTLLISSQAPAPLECISLKIWECNNWQWKFPHQNMIDFLSLSLGWKDKIQANYGSLYLDFDSYHGQSENLCSSLCWTEANRGYHHMSRVRGHAVHRKDCMKAATDGYPSLCRKPMLWCSGCNQKWIWMKPCWISVWCSDSDMLSHFYIKGSKPFIFHFWLTGSDGINSKFYSNSFCYATLWNCLSCGTNLLSWLYLHRKNTMKMYLMSRFFDFG